MSKARGPRPSNDRCGSRAPAARWGVPLPKVIEDMARELDGRREHTPASLGASLRRAVTIDDVAPFVRFDAKNYVRSLVTRGDGWEIRLLCWRPGQTSTLHGHGASACAFRILRGSASLSTLGSRDRVLAPGDIVEEDAPGLVHQVGNVGSDALLSLHVYSPPLPVDAPSPREGRNIVIVGGGLSGVAVATHLLRRSGPDLRVSLVERGPWLGRGVAYGRQPRLPAERPRGEDEPRPGRARRLRALGVRERDARRVSPARGLRRVRRRALRRGHPGEPGQDPARARPGRARRRGLGRPRRRRPPARRGRGALDRHRASARAERARGRRPRRRCVDECALAALPGKSRLLILGAGLTALDVVAFLDAHGFAGDATVLSRRGPCRSRTRRSREGGASPGRAPREPAQDAPRAARGARRVVREVEARGDPWQHAIDAIRPHIGDLWRGSPPRTARASSARRAPTGRCSAIALPRTPSRPAAWRARGRLEVVAGSVVACHPREEGLEVEVRRAGGAVSTERYAPSSAVSAPRSSARRRKGGLVRRPHRARPRTGRPGGPRHRDRPRRARPPAERRARDVTSTPWAARSAARRAGRPRRCRTSPSTASAIARRILP